jgi:hypothetical protein
MCCCGGESAIEQVYVAYRESNILHFVIRGDADDGLVVEAGLMGVHFFE